MSVFTPLSGSLGGSLIGFSAVSLLLGNGDIMGCSGIVASIFIHPKATICSATSGSERWKVVFLAVFLLTSKLIMKANKDMDVNSTQEELPPALLSDLGYCIAGLLVGFGTRLGNGCTSGHGICGLARRSKRSFAAVITFMSTAILTATIPWSPKKWLSITSSSGNDNDDNQDDSVLDSLESFYPTASSILVSNILIIGSFILLLLTFVLPSIDRVFDKKKVTLAEEGEESRGHEQTQGQEQEQSREEEREQSSSQQESNQYYPRKAPVAALSAATFSAGLYVSGMIKPHKIHNFLDLKLIPQGAWDATLIVVMGCGLFISGLGYHFVKGHNTFKNDDVLDCPLIQKSTSITKTNNQNAKFNIPTNTKIDRQLIFGSAVFGVGWGLGSLCVGTALFLAANGYQQVLISWWPCMIIGSFLGEKAKKYI
eukprot:CAMPEP_0203652168 /NCGR_PEP_ID=MMETSP0088-20131115/29427_1 /ASSEMBLY_ACC=CAM_ASM_001087 /TAXON_ID=426623 /ORGANISM="Chaetoceros affinis, Strain CCMP159" /LENGTH=426 /DNA_ID=CAMNT_0050511603 /DNA_START=70 /DNA_END=1350 /DNA_ORIENTATION=+